MFTKEEFERFSRDCDEPNVWQIYQRTFKTFWTDLIMNASVSELSDSDIDPIIQMLDQNGRGNTKGSIVVAKTFIRMGMWYRAFRSLKDNLSLRNKLNEIFVERNDEKLVQLIDEFEEMNRNLKNGLSGKNAVVLNAILALNAPDFYIFAVSLEHRNKILQFLYGKVPSYSGFGDSIVASNRKTIDFFRNLGIEESTRCLTLFIYSQKQRWDSSVVEDIRDEATSLVEEADHIESDQSFLLEKYFEDFLIGNWESTDLGKKYDLIYKDGELLSQQYKTDIGIIDLLVKERETDTYVVIELKRNQTSDVTVGQVMRYIGWVKAKLSPDRDVKGVVIGYENDIKLNYAVSTVRNIEVLLYRIRFSLSRANLNLT